MDQEKGYPLSFRSATDDFYQDETVLSVLDPDEPERELWSRPNAGMAAYCANVLVLSQHTESPSDHDIRDLRLAGVDPETGTELWRSRDEKSGAVIAQWCDSERTIVGQEDEIVASDLATGEVRWRLPIVASREGRREALVITVPDQLVVQGWN